MTKAWNVLQGGCLPHSLRETPAPTHPSHSPALPHPLLSEGCFCWVIDAKVLLIRKNETSNQPHREVDRLWRGGVCVRGWIKRLKNTTKGRINQSFFPISVLTFSVFLLSNPSSISVFFILACVRLSMHLLLYVCAPSRPHKLLENERKVWNANYVLPTLIVWYVFTTAN